MEVVTKKLHKVMMEGRKSISFTCVSEVLSFSETNICVKSDMGKIQLLGSGLKIIKFDNSEGILEVSGNINSLKYLSHSGGDGKSSLASRLFK